MTIKLEDLSIGYRSKSATTIVAAGINASVESGCLTCLIGENGIGKSTLLRTLSGFQPSLSGHIYIKGKDMAFYTPHTLSRKISVVLTTKPDVMSMTVREIVSLGRTPYTGFWGTLHDDDKAVVQESMEMVGISRLESRLITQLSDGERQKMMIAKALAQKTPIIVLDEPTAYLDYPSKVEMMQLLLRLSREAEKTIFLSTHDLEIALQVADTLWIMTHQAPISIGSPRNLADSGALSAFIDRSGIRFDPATMSIKIKS